VVGYGRGVYLVLREQSGKDMTGDRNAAETARAAAMEQAAAILAKAREDPLAFLRFLRIKPKEGGVINFIPNDPQKQVLTEFTRQWQKLGRVRLIVLKPRQPGSSTLFQALMFWRCSQYAGQNGLVVAQDDATTKRLFGMMRTFYDTMPVMLRPSKRVGNERALIFEEPEERKGDRGTGLMSRIDVQTARNVTAGTGLTSHFLQVSELAKWLKPEETMLSLLQSLPDASGSVGVIESTAKGYGNYFHLLWDDSYYHEGKSGFSPVFISVLDCPEYELEPGPEFEASTDDEVFGNEKGLMEADARWTPRKLAWRRSVILTKCNRDPREFSQEYPATPEEAFLTSGRCFFVPEMLARLSNACKLPSWKGDVVITGTAGELKDRSGGDFWIWEQPQENVRYVVGADTSLGIAVGPREESDFSVGVVLRHDTGLQVATFKARIDPDLFGLVLAAIGRHYNKAYIVPEIDQSGLTAIRSLVKDAKYLKVHMRQVLDQKRDVERVQLGWSTTQRTRRPMLDKLNEALRDGLITIQDGRIIKECMSFQVNSSGRPEAERGSHDDMVFATGLAVVGLEFAPHNVTGLAPQPDYEAVISELTGY